MSASAIVDKGIITNQTTAAEKAQEAVQKKAGGNLDKDAFLQLLVAQMKYQDPLEPTSNTEYISQLATFSELEEMQNVSASMDMYRANSLVGQYVFMDEENGFAEGQVDYVVYQGGKIYLSVNEELYNIDNLDTVADPEYLLATRLASSFATEVSKFKKPEFIKESDIKEIEELITVYGNMTEYQQSYIPKEAMDKFKEILEAYEAIKPEESESSEKTEDSKNADGSNDSVTEA